MHLELDDLWMDTMEPKLDERITDFLKNNHRAYQKACGRHTELKEQCPALNMLWDEDKEISLNEEECHMLREYLANQADRERLEKEYHYYYGQSDVISYLRMLICLQKEVIPEGALKKKRMADIIGARTGDTEYRRKNEAVRKQEKVLKDMEMPEGLRYQVDKFISVMNDCWSRYSDLAYHCALRDMQAFQAGE